MYLIAFDSQNTAMDNTNAPLLIYFHALVAHWWNN